MQVIVTWAVGRVDDGSRLLICLAKATTWVRIPHCPQQTRFSSLILSVLEDRSLGASDVIG